MFIIPLLFISNSRLEKKTERDHWDLFFSKSCLYCSAHSIMIYSQKCFSLCSVAVSQSWVFDKMVHVSVTVHEIQDRAHLYPAGRPLPWGAWTSKWERQTGSRDLSSTEAEVAMLWAARLFAVMFPPWPLQLLVRIPGLQEHSSCREWHLVHRVSPQAALTCLPCPWHPTQCGTHRSGFLSSFFLTWNSVSTKQTYASAF